MKRLRPARLYEIEAGMKAAGGRKDLAAEGPSGRWPNSQAQQKVCRSPGGTDQSEAAWEERETEAQDAEQRRRLEFQRLTNRREQDERQIAQLREEVERVAGVLMNEVEANAASQAA